MCKCCDQPSENAEPQPKKSSPPPPPPIKQEEKKVETREVKEESDEIKEIDPMWKKPVSTPTVPTTSAYGESPFEIKHPEIFSDSESSTSRDKILKYLPDTREVSVDEQIDFQPIS
ncbi:hypothetical protein M9Y10_045800 [Tritrichomonas musculus]|uniref:Uncharacterized protein n=1 Tax=Tritrichomonas musculus TaxID=1915356 RepID=A0ABR2JWQ3_9EUKA